MQLVHDYWAANVWALYLFVSKIASFIVRKSVVPASVQRLLETHALIPFPEPAPSIVAMCLLMGLVPALVYTWRAASHAVEMRYSGAVAATFFVHAVVSDFAYAIFIETQCNLIH